MSKLHNILLFISLTSIGIITMLLIMYVNARFMQSVAESFTQILGG